MPRITKTKVRSYKEETGKFYNTVQKLDLYSVTDGVWILYFTEVHCTLLGTLYFTALHYCTQDGRFLHHFVKNSVPEGSTMTPSEVVAKQIYDWCVKHGVHLTLKFIGGDSTNSNTGLAK